MKKAKDRADLKGRLHKPEGVLMGKGPVKGMPMKPKGKKGC